MPFEVDAHERGRLEVRHHDDLPADEGLGPVVLGDPGDEGPRLVAEPDGELQELLRLRHRLGRDDLGDPQVEALELVDA